MSAVKRPWRLWLSQLNAVWKPISIVAAALTFVGLLGSQGWLFEVAGIFRVQYAILLFAGIVIFAIAHKWLLFTMSLAGLLTNLVLIVPLYLPIQPKVPGVIESGKRIRVLVMNVNSRNRDFERVFKAIDDLSPDIISIEEVDAEWEKQLRNNLSEYVYSAIKARSDNFGIALFSRLPMNAQMKYFGSARVPSIVGTVKTAGGSFLLLSTHTLPPRALDYFFYRNDQLAAIGSFLAQANGTVILAGDLNAPPWSPFFQKLCSEARLIDSERGFGVQPTWPTNTSLLWIPIDHLLYRGKITVLRRNVYHYVGSDHFPVCVDLNIAD